MPILVLALKSIKQYNVDDNTLDVVYGVLKKPGGRDMARGYSSCSALD